MGQLYKNLQFSFGRQIYRDIMQFKLKAGKVGNIYGYKIYQITLIPDKRYLVMNKKYKKTGGADGMQGDDEI